MLIEIGHKDEKLIADLAKPIDISIPLHPNEDGVNCFYAPRCTSEPVRVGNFVGSIEEGGILNFKNLFVNPHGSGTHTECVEHISSQNTSINSALQKFHFIGKLITVRPEESGEDKIITKEHLVALLQKDDQVEALVIRTIPNADDKLNKNYSGDNPAYCEAEAIHYLKEQGIQHLIIDLPSVDKEKDEGKLLAHKAFWNTGGKIELTHTITELVYIPDHIKDGFYLVNIQITSVEMDASLSKVVLYELNSR